MLESPYGAHAERSTIASPSSGSIELLDEAGLARPGLADDRHHATVAVAHELDRGIEQCALVCPPDERDVAAHRAHAGPRGARDQPRLLILVAAAQTGEGEQLAVDGRRAQRSRSGSDEHAARRGERLQPGGGVDDIPHRRVVGAGEDADQHLAGVDADAHLDRRVGTGLGDERGERALHPQGGPHGPLGVVLVGNRGAEQGDDGVAEQLVDAPAEALDVGDEALEARLDEALDPLRIEVLGQRRVADQIGEQHGDDAPLLQRAVGLRHGRPARRAEARPRRHRVTARTARDHRHPVQSTAGVSRASAGGSNLPQPAQMRRLPEAGSIGCRVALQRAP